MTAITVPGRRTWSRILSRGGQVAAAPAPRRGRPCASTYGATQCALRVGHNFAHRAEVDGGLLAWENPYAPDGRVIEQQRDPVTLPDGYEALLHVS